MALLVGWALAPAGAGERHEQPVQYNHKVHAEQLGINCSSCHEGTESRRRAGFPPDDVCGACHSAPQSDSPKEAKLIELLEAGRPLQWWPVTRLASHVLFSHQRHVAVGNVDCAVCHGDMRERTVPISEPVIPFNGRSGMLRCIGCHVESGSPYAGTGCVDCHR
jgi:hypothetical protein